MSSELAPRPATTAAVADSDHRYKSVQLKLKKLAAALDNCTDELTALRRSMQRNAEHAESRAAHIAHGELDKKFVDLTSVVSVALGGAAVEVGRLTETAQDVASRAHEAQRKHMKMYSALDDVRSGRRERTPKPGFFERR